MRKEGQGCREVTREKHPGLVQEEGAALAEPPREETGRLAVRNGRGQPGCTVSLCSLSSPRHGRVHRPLPPGSPGRGFQGRATNRARGPGQASPHTHTSCSPVAAACPPRAPPRSNGS